VAKASLLIYFLELFERGTEEWDKASLQIIISAPSDMMGVGDMVVMITMMVMNEMTPGDAS